MATAKNKEVTINKSVDLGGGAYARFMDYGAVVLTSGSDREHDASGVMVLEPEVLQELVKQARARGAYFGGDRE